MLEIQLLLMLLIANGSPVVVRTVFGDRWGEPIDGGRRWRGQPLFGKSKTWRGLVAALLVSGLTAPVLGLGLEIGLVIGSLAMLGDLSSSFIKRRFRLKSGAQAIGLDHLPESLLPLLGCIPMLGLNLWQVIFISASFMLAVLLVSRALYAMGIGDHPH